MSGRWRSPDRGQIDRSRPIRFSFDRRIYQGFAGDTLASALLANGVHLVGRSFKYHRPRGVLSAGPEDPSALVTVRRDAARYTPNLNATQVELYEGLEAESQNRWPSLRLDFGRTNDFFSRFIPAGFYYNTFMWPRKAWHRWYEPRIRAAAGLGHAPRLADPDHYAQRYAHCETLVVGAGPAGLAAAADAVNSGGRVILCDEQAQPGGTLLAGASDPIDGRAPAEWLSATVARLRAMPQVTLLSRTTAFAYLPHNMVALVERVTDHLPAPAPQLPRERLWLVRAAEVILAAGAIERPLVFPGNDRPGIMLAEAARTYLNRYGVLPGERVAVLTAHDAAYRAALDLQAAGVNIMIVADLRPRADGPLPDGRDGQAGLVVKTGMTAVGTRGSQRVKALGLAACDADGRVRSGTEWIACDTVLMSGGYTPSVHLFSQSRGRLRWDERARVFVPDVAAERCRSVGACSGVPESDASPGWLGALPRAARWGCGQGVRRLAKRRHGGGPEAGGARGFPLD